MDVLKDFNVTEFSFDDITLTCRWMLEGIMLPGIGIIGIIGKTTI